MGIAVIGGARELIEEVTAASVFNIPAAGTNYRTPKSLMPSGTYRLKAYVRGTGTPVLTFRRLDSNFAVSTTVTSYDFDTGSSNGYAEAFVTTDGTEGALEFNMNAVGFIVIQALTFATLPALAITTVTSSQNVTFQTTATCVLIGGGAGGQNGTGTYTNGGGGGSGYIQKFSLGAGTRALVVGGGGGSNANGTASTFGGNTANGGTINATFGHGGAGGSGGGAGDHIENTYWTGSGAGGSNGSSGNGAGSWSGGTGSTVTYPLFDPVGSNTNGRRYGGGQGGAQRGGSQAGANATDFGGGGQGGQWQGVGGTGFQGALIYLEG